MESFLLVLHVILSFVIVIVILMQSGQGGGLGAGFNNAAALGQEVFGGRGAAGFLVKMTVVLGASFMITSMALAWYSSKPQSALDLQMEADEPVQSQVHQVLEEGQGPFDAPELEPDGLDLDMPGAQPQPMPGSDQPAPGGTPDSPIELDIDGDGDQIPPEIREQLEELELDMDEAPEPADGAVEPVELEEAPEPEVEEAPEPEPEVDEQPEVEEAAEPEVEETPEPEEAPEPEVEETPEPEVEETPEPEVEEAPEPEVEEAPEPEVEEAEQVEDGE